MKGALWLWIALLVSAAALLWVVNGVAALENAPGYGGHYYESLVDGFLKGQTSLSIEPSPELLKLPDPYDPRRNFAYRLSDATLYHGKYYIYYGPTPAVVLMLPWRVLTGSHIPERIACVVFATLALGGLGLLLSGVRDRHFPGLSGWVLAGIVLIAMHAAWLPVTLRRPGFWELPHAAALACLWWSLFFLWRCRSGGGGAGWALALGASLALLLGSRPSYLFAAGVIALVAVVPAGARSAGAPRWRAALALACTLGLGGALLLWYNYARFGKFGEFGQSYQLFSGGQEHASHFSAAFVAFNAWLYLGSLPDLSPYFPFVKPVWPGELPSGYLFLEEMHGVCFGLPVLFAGWAAVAWAWRRRRTAAFRPEVSVVVAGAATSLLAAAVLVGLEAASSRYITELTGGWTVVAALGLMVIFAPPVPGPAAAWRRPLRLLAVLTSAWTVAYVWLASFEHGELFRYSNPAAYSAMARPLNRPSLWVSRWEGREFGPVELTVALAPFQGPDSSTLLASGRPSMMNRLLLHRIDAGHAELELLQNDSVVAELARLETSGTELRVRVFAPWLYPPVDHPYWDTWRDPAERRERQTLFALKAAGQSAAAHSAFAFDPTGFAPYVLGPGKGTSAWVSSMTRVDAVR